MILTLDIGNTRIKATVFDNNKSLEQFIFTTDALQESIDKILTVFPKISDLVVSNVGKIQENFFSIYTNRINIHLIDRNSNFPFKNLYKTPQTLGIDRMVLAAGAVLSYPNNRILVIDAGTAITYDFIDENQQYLGGAISPGIRLRYHSLHQYTAKLPLLDKEEFNELIGKSTSESIHSGVINGVVQEIEGFIAQYQKEYSNFTIILTGGDSEFLAKRFKSTIFVAPNFLSESLNALFQYNKIK